MEVGLEIIHPITSTKLNESDTLTFAIDVLRVVIERRHFQRGIGSAAMTPASIFDVRECQWEIINAEHTNYDRTEFTRQRDRAGTTTKSAVGERIALDLNSKSLAQMGSAPGERNSACRLIYSYNGEVM